MARSENKVQGHWNDKGCEQQGKLTFQRLSTEPQGERPFCPPSDLKLKGSSAVSRPLSEDDGAWQYGEAQETHVQCRNVPSQQQVLCLEGI